jgi:DNA-binding GntR family transcriptional regulator
MIGRDIDSLGFTDLAGRTLSDDVARQLRQAVLDGRLAPGQRIVERDIAEAMGTSRGPVRDALRLLENEGLVIRYPHRGTYVARLTLEDAEEIYSLRQALEMLAVEYVIERASSEQLDELDELIRSMERMMETGYDQYEATDIDIEFHVALCRISGHTRLLAAWETLKEQFRVFLLAHRTLKPRDFEERAVLWHRRIVGALRQRDIELARQVMHEHVIVALDSMTEDLFGDPEQAPGARANSVAP